MNEEELKEAHRKHVEEVRARIKDIEDNPQIYKHVTFCMPYEQDYDSFVKIQKKKDEDQKIYEEGKLCEKCGCKNFTAHNIDYGLELRCLNCKNREEFECDW